MELVTTRPASRLSGHGAAAHKIPVTARLPIDPAIPQAADAGDIEGVDTNMLDGILAAVEQA